MGSSMGRGAPTHLPPCTHLCIIQMYTNLVCYETFYQTFNSIGDAYQRISVVGACPVWRGSVGERALRGLAWTLCCIRFLPELNNFCFSWLELIFCQITLFLKGKAYAEFSLPWDNARIKHYRICLSCVLCYIVEKSGRFNWFVYYHKTVYTAKF